MLYIVPIYYYFNTVIKQCLHIKLMMYFYFYKLFPTDIIFENIVYRLLHFNNFVAMEN